MAGSETVEYIQHFISTVLQKTLKFTSKKADSIAVSFPSVKSFTSFDHNTKNMITADGKEIKLDKQKIENLEKVKTIISPKADLVENWIRFTAHHSTSKFMKNISELKLDDMNMNPFLIKAMHLQTPQEVLRFNVYQTVSRSIVTSMGTALEYMIADSGGRRGRRGEWYDVVKEQDSQTYWIQVKSGPNNIDKDQVIAFNRKFSETAKLQNNHPRLGITYGKRNLKTVSLGLVKKYMDDWEERLLVGKDLWDFMSEEKNYHRKVLSWIEKAAVADLKSESIDSMIQKAITRLLGEFKSKYGDGKQGVQKYLDSII